MLLKSQCDGQIKITNQNLETYASTLGLKTGKALKFTLQKLLKLNWIGYNPKSEYYFIRGFNKIRQLLSFKSKSAAEFDMKDIGDLKGFIAAEVIGYLVNCQKRKQYAVGLKKRRPKHTANTLSDTDFYPIANKALATILGISQSTAFELKKLAVKAKFIFVKKNFKETGIRKKHFLSYLIGDPINAVKSKIKNGFFAIQEVDTVFCCLRFKRRK